MATNAKSVTSGTFEVKTDNRGNLRADVLSFADLGSGFKVAVKEGVGGVMEPKKYFELGFPEKSLSATYDVKQLSVATYKDWSEIHSYDYVAKSGSVTVSYTDSPRKTEGKFDLVMKLQGNPNPPGPEELKVSGTFNLKNA
ncbi:hypothetical protein PS718_02629 [Pseudomonas fluorescens]|uniref:Uncharacterized protein n=1 Tax=Pseudomonas fluorescens TaxID=294 RepID=A0A5E7C8L6_PSEFL|nr:hypothetical protein [Pseudomonas fluorescens]VVO00616.1 hypothetical protein PS718_02629 [Pseudomonas fluorescens]